MLNLSQESLKNVEPWVEAGIDLPGFSYNDMIARTGENPTWVHFGAGNIFRGFVAALQQTLLNKGKADTGIIAVEAYDLEIIDRIYVPYDNLSLLVVMNPDGTLVKKVIGSVGEALEGDMSRPGDWKRLREIFTKPSLQTASFTITEKGYSLKKMSGAYLEDIRQDMLTGPEQPRHIMAKIASLAYARYLNGAFPLAFVSMDNCSHNGEKLHDSVETIAQKWVENGLADSEFVAYINDPNKVALERIKKSVTIPVVGIGGIKEMNVSQVMSAGIDGVAVVSAILGAEDCYAAARRLRELLMNSEFRIKQRI
ncbi:thiamine-phosphate diphosphorylase [Acididesulfobacillus acetoxydans]|uniref:Mannitol dehydrogenase domain protein n=1 Tax=Acididesulfobacillus acetoxydans TaxID=1561005 RepID=A0A8S0W5K3_9FIRM|nr:thiamine-phosphate diphosphorylase [Acididesulfobacillus acetoxydans]CEJ06047.1 Mannitol dehydrogenase domain protein [Acididesulfobacillus acetoxydans]